MPVMKGLRYLRVSSETTQETVAEHIGVTPSHYSKMERGLVQPKMKHLVKLAKFFEVPIEDLM